MAYQGSSLTPFFGTSLSPLFGLRREIDRMLGDVAAGSETSRWVPAVDIRESEKALAIDVELPGIAPENVDVSVENGILTIAGEKHAERTEDKKGRYHVVERTYGSFLRSFQLPKDVDESQIAAKFHDGVLTVEVPKAALPQPRKIAIATPKEGEVKTPVSREPVSRGASSPRTHEAPGAMAAQGAESKPDQVKS